MILSANRLNLIQLKGWLSRGILLLLMMIPYQCTSQDILIIQEMLVYSIPFLCKESSSHLTIIKLLHFLINQCILRLSLFRGLRKFKEEGRLDRSFIKLPLTAIEKSAPDKSPKSSNNKNSSRSKTINLSSLSRLPRYSPNRCYL